MKQAEITIIGLGLIGGSLAKALREKLGYRNITAVDADSQALEQALNEGTIARGLAAPDGSISSADVIFLCTPIKQAIRYLDELADGITDSCIVTDVCSTKGEIVRHAEAMPHPLCFIGGHPMAGTEKSGYANSFSHMFENAYYVLTPSSKATAESVSALKEVIGGIGALPVVMSVDEHDRATGSISHLPHVIASALVNVVRELDNGSGIVQKLAAGGFRDITRIASSSPDMWESIVTSNKAEVLKQVELLEKKLKEFRGSLANEDAKAIHDFFSKARQFRNSLSTQATGLIEPVYRLIADIRDRPGIIGEIATMLGNCNINIKNINVTNSRESEQGCLTITLPDNGSVNIAFDLLVNAGYKVYKVK